MDRTSLYGYGVFPIAALATAAALQANRMAKTFKPASRLMGTRWAQNKPNVMKALQFAASKGYGGQLGVVGLNPKLRLASRLLSSNLGQRAPPKIQNLLRKIQSRGFGGEVKLVGLNPKFRLASRLLSSNLGQRAPPKVQNLLGK